MFDEWVQQLQSPDPHQRRQAVIALANARNPAALKALAAIFHGDPDPELRELALKAGRFIRQETGQTTGAETRAEAPEPPPASAKPAQKPDVSKRDAELAQFYLDAATNYQTLGDRGRAIEHLGKALTMNPARAQETFVDNLIQITTDLPVDEAMPLLTHPDRREELIRRIGGRRALKKRQKHGEGIESATWDNVALDFLVYALIISLCLAAIFVLVLGQIQDMLDSMTITTPSSTHIDIDPIMTASAIGLIVMVVFYGITSTISLAIQGAAIHTAATLIMGGDGTLVYLYRRIVPFQTWTTFGMTAGFLILMLFGSTAEIWFLTPMLLAVASVGVAYYTAELVSQVYNFGWFSGCVALFFAGLLLGAIYCGANMLLLSIMGGLSGSY
jgi:hypothetical protein